MILLQTWWFSITICWVTRRYRLNNHSYIPSINGTIPTRTYPPLVRCGRPVPWGNPGEMVHGAMVSDIRRRTTPIFCWFSNMFPRYVPPKNRRSYCLGIIFGFSKGTYLASGIAVLGIHARGGAFFCRTPKRMMDHWIILHLLGDSFNIILQQKPQWFLSKHSTMWDHN